MANVLTLNRLLREIARLILAVLTRGMNRVTGVFATLIANKQGRLIAGVIRPESSRRVLNVRKVNL